MTRRHTQRRKVKVQELIDELSIGAAQRLKVDSDSIEPIVRAIVAYLVDEYPSQDFYVPAQQEPEYPVERIVADLNANHSIRAIAKRYRVSRRTVYRINEARQSAGHLPAGAYMWGGPFPRDRDPPRR